MPPESGADFGPCVESSSLDTDEEPEQAISNRLAQDIEKLVQSGIPLAAFKLSAQNLQQWRMKPLRWLPPPQAMLRLLTSRGFSKMDPQARGRYVAAWLADIFGSKTVSDRTGWEATELILRAIKEIHPEKWDEFMSKDLRVFDYRDQGILDCCH